MSGNIRTSCTDCGAQYGGNAGHCKACHRTFSSDSAFDRHLVSRVSAGCHDPAILLDKQERQVLTYDPDRDLWKFVDHTGGARLAGFRSHVDVAASQGSESYVDHPETGEAVSVASETAEGLWITSMASEGDLA